MLLQAYAWGKNHTTAGEGEEECALTASVQNMKIEARHPGPERDQEIHAHDQFVHFKIAFHVVISVQVSYTSYNVSPCQKG